MAAPAGRQVIPTLRSVSTVETDCHNAKKTQAIELRPLCSCRVARLMQETEADEALVGLVFYCR